MDQARHNSVALGEAGCLRGSHRCQLEETGPQGVVAYITGAKTSAGYESVAEGVQSDASFPVLFPLNRAGWL